MSKIKNASPDGLGNLMRSVQQTAQRTTGETQNSNQPLPPVEKWNPQYCGDMDMEIRQDGSWYYLGTPIGRERMVRLFSTILIREDDKYYLITPVEKIGINVVDAPFRAVEMNIENQGHPDQTLTVRTNMDDVVDIGPNHPLRFDFYGEERQLKPYVLIRNIRGALEALLSRPLLYQLIDYGEDIAVDGVMMFSIRSGGQVFPIMPTKELEQLSA